MKLGAAGSDSEPASSQRQRGRSLRLGALVVLVFLAGGGIALVVTRPASSGQKAAAFRTMVEALRADLLECNTKVATALSSWHPTELGDSRQPRARMAAQAAARACAPSTDPAIFQLTVYSLPPALSGLHLDYAVSALGVWAQEDVTPAMRNEVTLLAHPGDRGAASAYRREATWAATTLATADSTLQRAADKLGVGHFRPIQLTSIRPAARLELPTPSVGQS
ncbi:MAG: hypothetical protein ACRENX_13145 [Candidatus Dormibacteria bacterium]